MIIWIHPFKRRFSGLLKSSFAFCLCLAFNLGQAEDCEQIFKQYPPISPMGPMRLEWIEGWDQIITWAFSKKDRRFIADEQSPAIQFHHPLNQIKQFNQYYGYFSPYRPLINLFTEDKKDLEVIGCLFDLLGHEEGMGQQQVLFASLEMIVKGLAYRKLEQGMTFTLMVMSAEGGLIKANYQVDEVIDLWHGMPAFGLKPLVKIKAPALLLFRGTDLSLTSEKGFASILSDLDISGPGFSTYLRGRPKIQKWLTKMRNEGWDLQVMGTSLGGALAQYTLIHEEEHFAGSPFPSVIFNAPGVSKEMNKAWRRDHPGKRLIAYVMQGDLVSKLGHLIGEKYLVSIDKPLNVIEAHALLMSAQSDVKIQKMIDPEE